MSCWALIPLKNTCLSKSRLMPHLTRQQRQALIVHMLDRVIDAARSCAHIDAVAMVGNRLPPRSDLLILQEHQPGLNPALKQARSVLRQKGAQELVILHADLPLIRADDIDALIEQGRQQGLGIAPDKLDQGTNALYLPTDLSFDFQFGNTSLRCHVAVANDLHIQPALVRRQGLGLDIDTLDDLTALGSETAALFAHTTRFGSSSSWKLSALC